MLKHRVIPLLLLSDVGLVKSTKFKNPKYVGDPINAIRIFNDKEVDELIVIDINATKNLREPNYALIEQFAGECFMPLAYGGGIQTVAQAERLFSLGVEKICIQTAALKTPEFITDLARRFGSQSIVVSIDIRKDFFGRLRVYQSATGRLLDDEYLNVICKLEKAGAGEILLNAVDRDGTLAGPDLMLIKQVSQHLDVPLIAIGGVSSLSDIKACVDVGASAVAAGAFFVFHGPHRAVLITYPEYHILEKLFEGNE